MNDFYDSRLFKVCSLIAVIAAIVCLVCFSVGFAWLTYKMVTS